VAGDPTKRPFWLHQIAEYLLGGSLVASGMQSPTPLVPSVIGALIVLNATMVKASAFSAFRAISRGVHRAIDPVLIAATVVGAAQPWIDVDSGSRVVLIGIAVVHGFIFAQSSFAERQRRQPVSTEGGRSTEIGRMAGRAVGAGVQQWRKRRPSGE
jgi:hypothetical protein